MAEEMSTELVRIIIVVLVVAASLFAGYYFIIRRAYTWTFFHTPNVTEQEKIEADTKFDQLIENLETCRLIEDTQCLCDALPDYFPEGFLLKKEDQKLELFLEGARRKTAYFEGEIYEYDLTLVEADSTKLFTGVRSGIGEAAVVLSEKLPNPRWTIPFLNKKPVSTSVYKEDDSASFLLTSTAFRDALTVKASELPKCSYRRKVAITEFEKIEKVLSASLPVPESYALELPYDYSIEFSSDSTDTIYLSYNERVVRNIEITKVTTEKLVKGDMFKLRLIRFSRENIMCSGSEQRGALEHNDRIEFKEEKNQICLFVEPELV